MSREQGSVGDGIQSVEELQLTELWVAERFYQDAMSAVHVVHERNGEATPHISRPGAASMVLGDKSVVHLRDTHIPGVGNVSAVLRYNSDGSDEVIYPYHDDRHNTDRFIWSGRERGDEEPVVITTDILADHDPARTRYFETLNQVIEAATQ